MFTRYHAIQLLRQDARALLARLDRVKSFALHETMVPAAAPALAAQSAIERYLAHGRTDLRRLVVEYMRWLQSPAAGSAPLAELQRRFSFLRLRFNTVLSQFDIFADVMTQRSEAETGVWLAGLDVLAADALVLPDHYYEAPPIICYLDRGHGAAIRRVRTRLPGGGNNPVAVIRVPRERMVSHGIASSLVHEVGHQGAALLDLVNSLRQELRNQPVPCTRRLDVNLLFDRWISEIVADFWSVAKVGVASTRGLMGVVSLPRAFVFRNSVNDPHPIPWIRVKLSCAMGNALYPHPQWTRLAAIWDAFYPLVGLDERQQQVLTTLEANLPAFVDRLVNHRPAALHGKALGEVIATADRHPSQLRAQLQEYRLSPTYRQQASPTLLFAIIGQAQADGAMNPQRESRLLTSLLTQWALQRTLRATDLCLLPRTLPQRIQTIEDETFITEKVF
jgi:hypothetical protein